MLLFMEAAVVVMRMVRRVSHGKPRVESHVVTGDEVGDLEPFLVPRNVGTSHHEEMIDF
jgi:hypothetical protein